MSGPPSPCSSADTAAHDRHWSFLLDFPWRRPKAATRKQFEEPTSSSASTGSQGGSWAEEDEPVDFEAVAFMAATEYDESSFGLSRRASREMAVSGLPLVCSNCGVSFFSLQITDDEVDCYCSGECKWSVIMYREMDRRLYALRPRAQSAGSTYNSSYASSSGSSSCFEVVDDVISCR